MTDVAIRVDNLGKQYRIGRRKRYGSLRDSLTNAFTAPFRRFAKRSVPLNGSQQQDDDRIWALKDVSFEVKRGEVVGIIGRNGAGKSTLLKILSRITEPTEGIVNIYGRVASLLEVGTGFHPELTGRENLYLNGAILGMTRAEIERKFDEIVAFAEVEKFIDTPVKHYSSGMYVRLAFAVAAHLEPEILLVDEVLAVGDYEFQKKCLGKMSDVAGEGRTVLFVSHNMNAVNVLCSRAILLRAGNAVRDGDVSDVVTEYLMENHESSAEQVWMDRSTAPGNDRVRLHAVRIVQEGKGTGDVDIHKDVLVEIEFWNLESDTYISTSIHLLDKAESPVLCSVNYTSSDPQPDEWSNRPYPTGLFRATCLLPRNFLNEGRYGISVFIRTNIVNQDVAAPGAVWFTVYDTSTAHRELGGWGGVIRPQLVWRTQIQEPVSQYRALTKPEDVTHV